MAMNITGIFKVRYHEFIQKNPNWTFIQGNVDEGISRTSTYKRESFLRMIDDAHRGLFDFIINKALSRFSRSTLDSIQYTQELQDANVGVLFQNDNINALDTDSEFSLVVMAGVGQDEVQKLSERLNSGSGSPSRTVMCWVITACGGTTKYFEPYKTR